MKISVVGIGNVLMSDEGVGIRVVEKLRKMGLKNVEIYDGGNLNFQLLEYIGNSDVAIFVDAVDFEGKPGDVKVFRISEVKGPDFFGIHDLDYTKVINIAKFCGIELPEAYVVGVKPKVVSEGLELSPEIEKAVDRAAEVVIDLISKLQRKEI